MPYNRRIATDFSAFYGLAVFASFVGLLALAAPSVLVMPFIGKVVALVMFSAAVCATFTGVRTHLNAFAFKREEADRETDEFVGDIRRITDSPDNPVLNSDLRHYALACSTHLLADCNEAIG